MTSQLNHTAAKAHVQEMLRVSAERRSTGMEPRRRGRFVAAFVRRGRGESGRPAALATAQIAPHH